MKTLKITTCLRNGIKDNQAIAVVGLLYKENFTDIKSLKMGKVFYIDVCDSFPEEDYKKLALSVINPIMDDYTIEVI